MSRPGSRTLEAVVTGSLVLVGLAVVVAVGGPAVADTLQVEPPDTEEQDSGFCDLLRPPERAACEAVSGAIRGGVGGVVTSGAAAGLTAVVEWVVEAAGWMLAALGELIDTATTPDVAAGWFTASYRDMTAVAVMLMLPLLLFSTIQALLRGSLSQLGRAFFVYVPVATVGMFAAITVVDLLLTITDELAGWVGRSLGGDYSAFATTVGNALVSTMPGAGAGAAVPGFAAFLGALVIGFSAFVIWVLLVLRQAAVYVAVLFLPLAFAGLVWPAAAHWIRRLAQGLIAIIMAKFVIVAVLSLAASALAATGAQQGFAVVVSGGALLMMAVFAPFVLFRLLPVFDAGMANVLEGTTNTRTSPVSVPSGRAVYGQLARASSARMAGGLAAPAAGMVAAGGSQAIAGAGTALSVAATPAAAAAETVRAGSRQASGPAAAQNVGRSDAASNDGGSAGSSATAGTSAASQGSAPGTTSQTSTAVSKEGATPVRTGGSTRAPGPATGGKTAPATPSTQSPTSRPSPPTGGDSPEPTRSPSPPPPRVTPPPPQQPPPRRGGIA